MTDHGDRPTAGLPETLAPGLRRVLAPNPSPMTYWGTNTYLLGNTDIAVIDPGPDDPVHLEAILAALEPGQRISHILVTHAHRDHSPLARPLAARTGAPVLAFGDAASGRSALMTALAAEGLMRGGEGVDTDFHPDRCLRDGETIAGDGWQVTALWTPGHMGNHLAFQWEDVLFTGDLVMGWASSLVSPPDGDMTAFMASCARLAALRPSTLHAGHGAPVTDPQQRIGWLMDHRRNREAQIVDALGGGAETLIPLTRRIYGADTDPALMPAAARNVLAHLIDLTARDIVSATPRPGPEARFELWRR